MAPQFSQDELSQRDRIIETHEAVKYLTAQFDKLEKGEIGVCPRHANDIGWIKRYCGAIAGGLVIVAGWLWQHVTH